MAQDDTFSGNPYNHQDAVRDPEFFVGRESELEQIEYELKQSKSSRPQYRNIGVTGKMGSGKSSVGHMIRHTASDLGLLPVHIRLNQNSAEDEIALFREIFGEISRAIGGQARESFIKRLSGITDQVELDLKFLRIYLSSDQQDGQIDPGISESILREDFEEIYSEADYPAIVLILDNAQNLAKNETLLQRMKNIFSDISGYNLVLIGTEDTFSNINDAFSPVARIFTKFTIGPFETYEETKQCVLEPLDEDEKELLSNKTIFEIYQLTGGRPYEINLICDYMYKNYQRKNKDKIELSSEVLDSVVDQLNTWRRPVSDSIVDQVESLSELALQVLIASIECPQIPRDWLVRYSLLDIYTNVRTDNIPNKRGDIEDIINDLLERNVLEKQEGLIEFGGGVYSQAYVKYYAYSRSAINKLGGAAQGDDQALIANIHYRLVDDFLLHNTSGAHSHFVPDDRISDSGYQTIVTLSEEDVDDTDVKGSGNITASVLSDTAVLKQGGNHFQESNIGKDHSNRFPPERTLRYRCRMDWLDTGFLITIHTQDEDLTEKIESRAEASADSLREIGFDLLFENEEALINKGISHAKDDETKKARECFAQALELNDQYPEAWLQRGVFKAKNEEFEDALSDIGRAIELTSGWTDAYMSKGHVHLDMDDVDAAVQAYDKATSIDSDNPHVWASVCHNLAHREEYELAIQYGREGERTTDGNDHLKYHIAEAELSLDNPEETLDICEELIENGSSFSSEARYIKARALFDLDQNQQALQILQELDDLEPFGGYYTTWAELEMSVKNYERAIELLGKAIEQDEELKSEIKENDTWDELRSYESFRRIVSN